MEAEPTQCEAAELRQHWARDVPRPNHDETGSGRREGKRARAREDLPPLDAVLRRPKERGQGEAIQACRRHAMYLQNCTMKQNLLGSEEADDATVFCEIHVEVAWARAEPRHRHDVAENRKDEPSAR